MDEDERISDLRGQLSTRLKALVTLNLLKELDERILSLRMGLEDGQCHTLIETASLLHKSPEVIRRHQYLALKRNMRDLHFFGLLKSYAHLVKLPRGLTYYLLKFSDYDDSF